MNSVRVLPDLVGEFGGQVLSWNGYVCYFEYNGWLVTVCDQTTRLVGRMVKKEYRHVSKRLMDIYRKVGWGENITDEELELLEIAGYMEFVFEKPTEVALRWIFNLLG